MKKKVFSLLGIIALIIVMLMAGCSLDGDTGSDSSGNGNGNGNGDGTDTKPGAPTGVKAEAESSSSITVSWNAVTGATSYDVYSSESINSGWDLVKTVSETEYTDTELEADTTYYYRVRTKNSAGESGNSSTVNAKTLKASSNTLAAPTGVDTFVVSPSEILIHWIPVTGATSYDVYYTKEGEEQVLGGNTTETSISHWGLEYLTRYTYRIKAKKGNQESDFSRSASATTQSASDIAGSFWFKARGINPGIRGAFGDFHTVGTEIYLNDEWFTFSVDSDTRLRISANDSQSPSSEYTGDIVVDIYVLDGDEPAIVQIGRVRQEDVDLGYRTIIDATWPRGTYYVKVKPKDDEDLNRGSYNLFLTAVN